MLILYSSTVAHLHTYLTYNNQSSRSEQCKREALCIIGCQSLKISLANTLLIMCVTINREPPNKKQRKLERTEGDDNPTMEYLSQYVEGLMTEDTSKQIEGATNLRNLLRFDVTHEKISAVIDTGVLPRLIEFLQSPDSPALQHEAAWIMTNISSGSAEQTKAIVDAGAVPHLIGLVKSTNEDVAENAMWTISNMAIDSSELRDIVLKEDFLSQVLEVLQTRTTIKLQRVATWTMSNFCHNEPPTTNEKLKPAIPILSKLISTSIDDEILENVCSVFSYLSNGPNDHIQKVIDAGVCPRIVSLLTHPNEKIKVRALKSVGNIVTGNDNQTQHIIDIPELFGNLLLLLSSPNDDIRKDACWTVSNIMAGTRNQIQSVIDANIFPPLIELLASDHEDVQIRAVWSMSNATYEGSSEQLSYLVGHGCIGPFIDLLTHENKEVKELVLEFVASICMEVDEEALGKDILTIEQCKVALPIYMNMKDDVNIKFYKKMGALSYLLQKTTYENAFLIEHGFVKRFIDGFFRYTNRQLRLLSLQCFGNMFPRLDESALDNDLLTTKECKILVERIMHGELSDFSEVEPTMMSYLLRKTEFTPLFESRPNAFI